MPDQGAKNFNFTILSDFTGYNSSRDKTNLAENYIVAGSQNVYKKLSGTLAVRQGQKRQGVINTAQSAIASEFVWNTSWGAIYTMVISNSNLYVVIDAVWYSLLSGLTDIRYVFDKWYNPLEAKDLLVFVHGNADLQWWSGGFATVASTTPLSAGGVTGYALHTAGTNYALNDIVTITGGGGTGATFKITALAPGFVPTALQQLTTGSGYSTGTNLATSGGLGSGLTLDITTIATVGTITKTNPSISWAQAGFSSDPGNPSAKKIMINGTEYTYSGGETTATLIGVSPDPSAITVGAVALQSVITISNIPGPNLKNDYLKVINNQVYIGSYTSRQTYISSNTAFLNYTVPVPRTSGSPELIILDGNGKGIGVRQGKAHIAYGTGHWAIISFTDITVGTVLTQQTSVDIKPVANLQAAYAHEFIDTVGDSLVYLAQDQQVRTFGDFTNLFTPGYPSLSQEIATELMEQNFSEGSLRCIGEFTYLCAPIVGKVWLYQVRQSVEKSGQVVAERLWHAPFIWNVTSVNEINSVIVGFSNANPQIYQLWDTNQWYDDSPSDEQLPYECIAAFAYCTGGRRQGLLSFDKNFTEGYLSLGTPLQLTINYNYQGALAVLTATVNSVAQPAYTFSGSLPLSLGDHSIGDEPIGDGFTALAPVSLPKFKVINSMNLQNCFEYQQVYSSNAANAQWELLAKGTNVGIENNENANYLINKRKN